MAAPPAVRKHQIYAGTQPPVRPCCCDRSPAALRAVPSLLAACAPVRRAHGSRHHVRVLSEDMTEEMKQDAIEVATEAFNQALQKGHVFTQIATQIRAHFDKEYGRPWSCIVGRSFGSYVTHRTKFYIYFSVVPGYYVLLWKS